MNGANATQQYILATNRGLSPIIVLHKQYLTKTTLLDNEQGLHKNLIKRTQHCNIVW